MVKPPQELEKLEKAEQVSSTGPPPPPEAKVRSVSRLISSQWSAPLPPPAALQQYDEIVPGGADRILQMAEREQALRIECERFALQIERDALQPSLKMGSRGQWLGWTLALAAVIGATVCALYKVPWQVPVALVGVPLLGAVQAIVEGRREKQERNKEREDDENG